MRDWFSAGSLAAATRRRSPQKQSPQKQIDMIHGLLIGPWVKKYTEQEFDLGLDPVPGSAAAEGHHLTVVARDGAALSPPQAEFNKLMKRLESARTKHERERSRLDQLLDTCTRELMPLVGTLNRLNHQMVVHCTSVMKATKLTARRKTALTELLWQKADRLLSDSWGLAEEDIEELAALAKELSPRQEESSQGERDAREFDMLRGVIEDAARELGVDLDLSDLDIHGDPVEFERQIRERLEAAQAAAASQPPSSRGRKPGKARMERERKQQEADEAKRRDLKSLYKQLAKALHPDLESDPLRRVQKEEWMKRLTTAHASGDLREMLCIEMEWLGVESSNLATASDEKLRVYGAVLKEQIAELKMQTRFLIDQPQYAALGRFRIGFTGFIDEPVILKGGLYDEIDRHKGMLETLKKGGGPCRKMIHLWADEHARSMDECPF